MVSKLSAVRHAIDPHGFDGTQPGLRWPSPTEVVRRLNEQGFDVVPHQIVDMGAAHQCGFAGHFSDAAHCLFHLHSRVGNFRISTVGDWRLDPRSADPGHGGNGAHWMTVGVGGQLFYYETMVFEVEGLGANGEGSVKSWTELERHRYETAEQAEAGHWAVVAEVAARVRQEDRNYADLVRRLKED